MIPPSDQHPAAPGQEIAPGVHVAASGLRLQFSRGSGPGGQNVNKVNTKVDLWIQLSEIRGMWLDALQRLRKAAGRRLTDNDELHLIADSQRTQEGNRREVMLRLRELIVGAQVQPKRRRKTRPSAASRRRRLESKRHRSEIKAHRRSGPAA